MPRIDNDIKLDFKDVLIRPKRSTLKSRADVDLTREFIFHHSKKIYNGIPIIASNMDTVGTFEMALQLSKLKLFTTIHKHYTVEQWKEFAAENSGIRQNVAISTGMTENDFKKLRETINAIPELDYICVDVANGYSEHFVEFVRLVRKEFPEKTIFAGNVVTGEMVEELILSGADIVKCGIGPGLCIVMLGGMLAGHDESGTGEIIERNGRKFKLFYGMSSKTAMDKHSGGVAEYRASEGKTVEVPYRGCVLGTAQDILGGVRSCCTYVGAGKLKELSRRTTFIRVSQQLNEIFSPNTIQG
ncbi:unnamed protein product [Rotaria sordida]|uniref:GMP reductase n=1 Tax=Rotaria sordida TaxID=392033 RepID=A0A819WW18_9BILA|nr:unnamed protein product [Rotaria sordida]